MKAPKAAGFIYPAVLVVLVLVLYLTGLFSFEGQDVDAPEEETTAGTRTKDEEEPGESVAYTHLSKEINGLKQEIHVLEVDLSNPAVEIMPVLAHDLVYGFENLSVMAERKGAYAAVNGGFFSQYGLPSGMVAIDGEIYTASTAGYPVLVLGHGKADLVTITSELWVETDDGRIAVDRVNEPARGNETVLYTKVYGSTNRQEDINTTVTVKDGRVTEARVYPAESRIPQDGFLITSRDPKKLAGLKIGDSAAFFHRPEPESLVNAYECGSWILDGGEIVIGDSDPWVGVMSNRDPRTAVGIKNDHTVILVTVDGRQPGYSAGLTGRELGELLLGLGARKAAMLDGGASTEMIVNGEMVNRPSFKGQERPLGGGIIVRLKAGG